MLYELIGVEFTGGPVRLRVVGVSEQGNLSLELVDVPEFFVSSHIEHIEPAASRYALSRPGTQLLGTVVEPRDAIKLHADNLKERN